MHPSKLMNTMKLNYLAYLSFFAAITIAGCTSQSKEKTTDETRSVPVAIVSTLDTIIHKDYIADIQAVKNVEIRSRLSGFLDKIYVEEGAEVRQGQVLFKINDEEYKTDLSKAEAALNNAIADAKTVELEQQRTKILVKNNVVSKSELDLGTAKLKAAESRIAEAKSVAQYAKSRLAHTLIRSPFNGRIDRFPLKEGSLLEEGSLLTSVSDLSAVNVYFAITEREYLAIASDSAYSKNKFKKQVKLTLANGEEYPFKGTATFAESEFASQTGSLSLKATFPNPNGLLKHGSSGKISVPAKTGKILVVHQKSVFEIQDRTYVYLLTADNKLKMTPFKAGQRVGHYYIVDSGLNISDKIVFEGTQSLSDGLQVKPTDISINAMNTVAQN